MKKQHLMIDPGIIEKICNYAEITPKDRILEIGPGTGNLTEALVKKAKLVYAIEPDPEMIGFLNERLPSCENLEMIQESALKLKFPEFDKVVSNLPYSISKRITEKLLQNRFQVGVLVYQREFAQKLMAREGTPGYRYISALTQSCSKVELLDSIPPEAFDPRPRVVSSIVRIKPKFIPEKKYMEFLHLVFNQRNKKLSNILDAIPNGFGDKRPSQLPPDKLRKLYRLLF